VVAVKPCRSSLNRLQPLSNAAMFTLPKLPAVHRDPFDRLLVCEAIQLGVPLVTPDAIIRQYPVRVRWG
jgi:PIN domain nuclease of toxin-antitoxin system